MRLTALTLTRYGNFDSEHIVFDPRPGVLNLLLAPNGGGKSVLRAAFCDLLFGIGGQTEMGFRYGYPGMRIAAEAIDPDQGPFCFGRRKGRGNTLVDSEGATLDPARITRLLGRTDRSRLERLFALDTERLRQGEADLLASDGELGSALISGAGGARDLRALRKSLEETRTRWLRPDARPSGRFIWRWNASLMPESAPSPACCGQINGKHMSGTSTRRNSVGPSRTASPIPSWSR